MRPVEAEFDKKLSSFVDQFLLKIFAANLDPITVETPSAEELFHVVHKEFEENIKWKTLFLDTVKALNKSGDELSLEQSIRFFGIPNSRIFLITYKLSEIIECKILTPDPKTNLITTPLKTIIHFANDYQNAFGDDSRYKDIAFASGLLVDILSLQVSNIADAAVKKALSDLLAASYTKAVTRSKTAIELAKRKTKLPMEKYIVAIPLLSEVSKVSMGILFPEYVGFLKQIEKSNMPLSAQILLEEEQFGGNHFEIAHFLSYSFHVIEAVSECVLNYHQPFTIIDPKDKDARDLAMISLLAWHLQQPPFLEGKHPNAATPILTFRPEFEGFQINFNPGEIQQVVKKIK